MYEHPIEIVLTQVQQKMADDILQVVHKYGIDVEKEELLKALAYDRNQYDKGYNDGHRAAMDSIVRCEKCKNWSKEKQGARPFRWCTKLFLYTERTFYCGNGERKDGAGE